MDSITTVVTEPLNTTNGQNLEFPEIVDIDNDYPTLVSPLKTDFGPVVGTTVVTGSQTPPPTPKHAMVTERFVRSSLTFPTFGIYLKLLNPFQLLPPNPLHSPDVRFWELLQHLLED